MTDPATELRDLVQQLARVHDFAVMQLGRRIGHSRRQPLLTLLREATAPDITGGGNNTGFGPRIAFDPTASELHTAIRARIRDWAIAAEVPRHWTLATGQTLNWRDPAQLLIAWHARTLHTDPERWIPTLDGWISTITELVVDPSRRWTLDAPCPRCGQRWAIFTHGDRAGEKVDALQITVNDGIDATTECRSCGARWEGLNGAEALREELHQLEHADHGIGCAGEVQLREYRPLELEVTIPIREAAFA
ncbi:MAG: hypothetical protein HIU88_10175 [Acidobacteria bacterium]|nr:hypothetical protein [Acidobacteriota bacterium]